MTNPSSQTQKRKSCSRHHARSNRKYSSHRGDNRILFVRYQAITWPSESQTKASTDHSFRSHDVALPHGHPRPPRHHYARSPALPPMGAHVPLWASSPARHGHWDIPPAQLYIIPKTQFLQALDHFRARRFNDDEYGAVYVDFHGAHEQ